MKPILILIAGGTASGKTTVVDKLKAHFSDDDISVVAMDNYYKRRDDISLEDKLVLAIATRLLAEKFLKDVMISNGINCQDAKKNQTREWFDVAKPYLNDSETEIIEEVNLITPENIHLNAFMYEPLIDISIWKLKDLFNKVYNLQNLGI